MSTVNLKISEEENDGGEALLVKWLKLENDYVDADDTIAIVETNKVTLEIVSPVSGYLIKLIKSAGDYFECDETVGLVKPGDENINLNKLDKGVAEKNNEIVYFSPAARSLMKKYNIDEDDVPLKSGAIRISKDDIHRYISDNDLKKEEKIKFENSDCEIISLSNSQAMASKNISRSMTEASHVTTFFEIDLSNVVKHKEEEFNRDVKVTFTAYYSFALIKTLKLFPELNAHYENNKIKRFKKINLGVVVAMKNDDLIVPVLKNIGSSSLYECAEKLNNISELARNGELKPDDVSNGTITISNYGVSGSLLASPIVLVRPQVAILGVGKINYKPIAIKVNDEYEMAIRPMLYISLTIDHRVINGSMANKFMTELCANLENFS